MPRGRQNRATGSNPGAIGLQTTGPPVTFLSMKKWFLTAAALSLLLVLPACQTPSTVDYDRALLENMQGYQSYAVVPREERAAGQHLSLTEIVDRRIVQAVHQNLQGRGLRRDEGQPDCRIAFFTTTEKHTEVQDLGLAGGYYRHGSGRGSWASYPPVSVDEYEEGTLVIDVIDGQSGQLAWRGAASRRLGHAAPDEARIRATVAEILAEFPPSAR